MHSRTAARFGVLLALVTLAAACTATTPAEPGGPLPSGLTPPAAASGPALPTVTAGPLTFVVEAPTGATVRKLPAAGTVRLVVSGLTPTQTVRLVLRVPATAHLLVEKDGSVAVVEGGATLGGLAPIETSTNAADATGAIPDASGRTLSVTTDGAAIVTALGVGTPRSATWGTHDGGRSLAVDPNTWARAAGQAGADATWSAVVAAHPDANTSGMHDQLTCHSIGAPTKATWNLEPWRPDVGLLATIAARCNP